MSECMSSLCSAVGPVPCWMQEFVDYRKERGKMLLSRRNQLLLEFSFWNEPVARPGPNIYELRSYQLRVNPRSLRFLNAWAASCGCAFIS